jgi:hypothetical protein
MQERTFNRRRRQLFRRRISGAEVGGGVMVLAALLGAVGWVAAQRDAYDPAERDLSFAVLQAQSVEDRLYRRPLVAWVEPGSGPAGAAAPALRLGAFPPAIVADGWRVSTRLQEFGPDNLYEKINGAAEQYLRFGFQRLHYVGLRREDGSQDAPPEELGIELYDQGDFAGGLGIFSAQRDPARPLRREGALTYYETAVGAIGVMGRWFFKVAGSTESPALQAKTRQLVAALSALPLGKDEVPFGYHVLTGPLGLPLGAVAYQAENAFQFGFARDFWFGQIGGKPAAGRFFLHRTAGPAEAAGLYERLLTEQRFDYDVLVEDEERAVLRHRFLKNHFALALAGPVVYGVENVMARADVEPALRRLEQALAASPEQRRER